MYTLLSQLCDRTSEWCHNGVAVTWNDTLCNGNWKSHVLSLDQPTNIHLKFQPATNIQSLWTRLTLHLLVFFLDNCSIIYTKRERSEPMINPA